MVCCSSHLHSHLVFAGIKLAGWTANSTCSHTSTCSPADSGQPGRTCTEKSRAAPPISSSPWPLQREGKYPLSCTSHSLPPAERPPAHTLAETNKDWTTRLQGVMHASVSAHHAHSVESHCAFDKVFLRMTPCRMTDGSLHRHQAATPTFSSLSTPTERQCWGAWTPQKNSGYFWNCHVCLRTCILCLALSFSTFPTCRVFQLCLVARLNTPWALDSTSLYGKLETPASQSTVRARRRYVN